MIIIRNLEDAVSLLHFKDFGKAALSDILFETFIQQTEYANHTERLIVILDTNEKFDKPKIEPLETVVGHYSKELYSMPEENNEIIIYTKHERFVECSKYDYLMAKNLAKDSPNLSIIDLQRELCVGYMRAYELYKMLEADGLVQLRERK